MFSFLTAKVYLRMVDSNDEHPVLRTIVYLTVLNLFLSMAVFIPLQTFVKRIGKQNIADIIFGTHTIILLGVLIPLSLYYYLVKKNKLESIVNRYGSYKINKTLLVFILFIVPLVLFLLGPTITVYLFGGSIMTHDYIGVLTSYLPAK